MAFRLNILRAAVYCGWDYHESTYAMVFMTLPDPDSGASCIAVILIKHSVRNYNSNSIVWR